MRADLFTCGESVLLVGEGNFSFSVGLVNLQRSLSLTTTCLEHEVEYMSEQENIEYLRNKGVRVLLGVDGTKLSDHHVLRNERFSKIVFNFPHVGGKMKINLNRQLLKEFCESASKLLECDGSILISLCKGQGGTAADTSVRRWDDTWQVVEMAAHGDLVLIAVEPFLTHVFPNYSCVGYRSRDTQFHMDGALVHIFSKKETPYPSMELDNLMKILEPKILETKFGNIKFSNVYFTKYNNNILKRRGSPPYFLSEALQNNLISQKEKIVKTTLDTDVPLYIKNLGECNCLLRQSLIDIFSDIQMSCAECPADVVVCSGLVFNPLSSDFTCPPVSCEMLLWGKDITDHCVDYFKTMTQLFKRTDLNVIMHNSELEKCTLGHSNQVIVNHDIVLSQNVLCQYENRNVIAQELVIKVKGVEVEICLFYPDKLAVLLFDLTGWRELWAQDTYMVLESEGPVLKPSSLYPVPYVFDINVVYDVPFKEEDLYNVLWDIAGDIIQRVEVINTFAPPGGWSAKCYRITYLSFEKPLFRKRVISIHDNVIGKVLNAKLGVRIT